MSGVERFGGFVAGGGRLLGLGMVGDCEEVVGEVFAQVEVVDGKIRPGWCHVMDLSRCWHELRTSVSQPRYNTNTGLTVHERVAKITCDCALFRVRC